MYYGSEGHCHPRNIVALDHGIGCRQIPLGRQSCGLLLNTQITIVGSLLTIRFTDFVKQMLHVPKKKNESRTRNKTASNCVCKTFLNIV